MLGHNLKEQLHLLIVYALLVVAKLVWLYVTFVR
jgi:hypothetical protein